MSTAVYHTEEIPDELRMLTSLRVKLSHQDWMKCSRCETFLGDILHQEFVTWRRVEEGWFTYRHGNYADVCAAAQSGCDLCSLFNLVRRETIPDYDGLSEKWHVQAASIDCKFGYEDSRQSAVSEYQQSSRWTFHLLTVAPEMSWIPFEIFKPLHATTSDHDDISAIPEWPMMVAQEPFSQGAIDIARTWVQRCVGSHTACTRSTQPKLPHRVIDVGETEVSPNPRLQINRGELGRYVTLSHCWGTGRRLTLTKANLNSFRQSIPFNQLPQTFQDAIVITKLLGERYIWIDALCIVQDDKEEWRQQSVQMYDIFESAIFSMSALSAEDSHSGILHPRNQRQIFGELNGTKFGIRTRLAPLETALQSSRLETRAWCLQERLLPAAILHIGPEQIYWECRTCTASETSPTESRSHPINPGSSSLHRPSWDWDWYSLVTAYSARKITHASDRFPAIDGLAQKMKIQYGRVAYIQGLWSHEIHAGLMWQRPLITHGRIIESRDKYGTKVSSVRGGRPSATIAASWSWASLNDAVDYPLFRTHSTKALSNSEAVFVIDSQTSGNLRQTKKLQLRALVIRGTCKSPRRSARVGCDASFRPSSSSFADEGVDCYLDYTDDPISKGCYCIRIANWATENVKSSRKNRKSKMAAYLILERIEIQSSGASIDADIFGAFRRVGMGYDDVEKVDKIFVNAKRQTMQLF